MGKLDDTISQVAYILDCLRALREIQESGSCNDCKHSMECRFAPKMGGLVRYNCPYYVCRMEGDEDVQ